MHKIFAAAFLAVLCVSAFTPANAAEKLNFDARLGAFEKQQILTYLQNQTNKDTQGVKIAQTDLNQDGIVEYVVKTTSCRTTNVCTYVLLANNGMDILNLGQFEARDVALGKTDSASLREILVFDNQANDFDYGIYRWNETENRYEMTPAKD